jgi:RND family efflux transporter MFP subunit
MILAGCGSKQERVGDYSANLPSAQVRVQTVESKSHMISEEVVGTVRAKLRAALEARVSGRIQELPVRLGDKVQRGQLIARLDAGEIVARLEQAEAAAEQAESDWKRISALLADHTVTRAEYDAAHARHRTARGAVAEARTMMSYVEIVAPFDGVVTRKWADVGDLAAPGKPLVDIEDPSALELEADVPEAIASRISRGSLLAVRVDAANRDLEGTVSEIAPGADPVSRTFQVKLELPQTPGVMPGHFARLSVPIGQSESVRVPASAVVQRGQLELVFSVTNDRAKMHLVKTGKRLGEDVEILSGLAAGGAVVTSGAERLMDGQPVEAR